MPPDSPVKFVFRADVSWDMERQSKELAGIVNMWICGDGILSWYPEVARSMKQRGDIVWFYSGPPTVTAAVGEDHGVPIAGLAVGNRRIRALADGQPRGGSVVPFRWRRHGAGLFRRAIRHRGADPQHPA